MSTTFRPVPQIGTARLFQLTSDLETEKKSELLEYIGKLERSYSDLLVCIQVFNEMFDKDSFLENP